MKEELICKIKDEDIGVVTIEMKNPELRLGARGIVIREDGKIAIFNKSNKNEYKLPGGGLEGEEEPEEAFKREVLEETGCEVEIIEALGTTEEYKSLNNFKQISYIFVGKVQKDTKQLNITEKEKDEGAKLIWETPEKALELITECFDKLTASKYESVYSTKFVVLRDRKILERYIKMNNKNIEYQSNVALKSLSLFEQLDRIIALLAIDGEISIEKALHMCIDQKALESAQNYFSEKIGKKVESIQLRLGLVLDNIIQKNEYEALQIYGLASNTLTIIKNDLEPLRDVVDSYCIMNAAANNKMQNEKAFEFMKNKVVYILGNLPQIGMKKGEKNVDLDINNFNNNRIYFSNKRSRYFSR